MEWCCTHKYGEATVLVKKSFLHADSERLEYRFRTEFFNSDFSGSEPDKETVIIMEIAEGKDTSAIDLAWEAYAEKSNVLARINAFIGTAKTPA